MAEAEYDQLSALLDRFKQEKAMNLEMLDGFFSALHCSPETTQPSAYLPELWGGGELLDEEDFESDQQANTFMELVMRFWNDVLSRLESEEVFLPILLSDESGKLFSGNDWAKGFMRGTEFNYSDWLDLMQNDEHGGLFVTIFALCHEHDPDPDMRPYKEPVSEALREKLLIGLSAGVMHTYRYFEPHRKMAARLAKHEKTFRRERTKVGRNDPCPCGSGKKYKKCCGQVTLH
ncbi:MAG: UPF0149 family protein [Burkholderiales bacterium]|nr:UPF0149 family protein [Nitrosomonas sp.]MCP5274106.1 UPF0149 family protein [Burkholderiales bacterium]